MKSAYKFLNHKKNYSPNRKLQINKPDLSIQVQEKRKRVMTEYDEQLHFPNQNNKSIKRNPKMNLFLKQIDQSTKQNRNQRILKRNQRIEYNNSNPKSGVQSTKNNQIKNQNIRVLYGGSKVPKKKLYKQVQSTLSLAKLIEKKSLSKKVDNMTIYEKLLINDIKRKIIYQKSLSRKKKLENYSTLNHDYGKYDINKLNINIEKPNQKKTLVNMLQNRANSKNQQDVPTVHILKKKKNHQFFQDTISPQQEINKYQLSQQELDIFGNRFPYGFQKIKLLGRGGFSLVWLGEHNKSNKLFAIKQIITQNNHQTHMKQIWFGSIFFTLGGLARPQFTHHQGIKNLAKMYSYEINQQDTWIFYQKCGNSLGSCLYDIKSDRFGGQKVYKMVYKPLYKKMIMNNKLLKKIIIEICKALKLLSQNLIVHSDLKTENILIRHDQEQITEVKLIDYGSSFSFTQINQFSMATPQYMSHQILNYILCENQSDYDQQLLEKVRQYKKPWVIDIWSLGCVLLQIINGIPLWMSLPVLIQDIDGQYSKKYGLFAVKGRHFQKIIDKQIQVISNLDQYLIKCNYSGIKIDNSLIKVLKGMLQLQPQKRMSPMEVIQILQQSKIN